MTPGVLEGAGAGQILIDREIGIGDTPKSATRDRDREREKRERDEQRREKERDPRVQAAAPSGMPAIAPVQKVAAAGTVGVATPRRREKKGDGSGKDGDIVKRLQQICTDADPTRLYRNLVRIGQGYVALSILSMSYIEPDLFLKCVRRRIHCIPGWHERLCSNQTNGPRKTTQERSYHQ